MNTHLLVVWHRSNRKIDRNRCLAWFPIDPAPVADAVRIVCLALDWLRKERRRRLPLLRRYFLLVPGRLLRCRVVLKHWHVSEHALGGCLWHAWDDRNVVVQRLVASEKAFRASNKPGSAVVPAGEREHEETEKKHAL